MATQTWLLVLLWGSIFRHVTAKMDGRENCPCTEYHQLDKYVDDNNMLSVQPAGEKGQIYKYSNKYGNMFCRKWDEYLEPYCADSQGTPKPYAPQWCGQKWCYVDKDNCALPLIYQSSYFPSENLYYSYTTCGSQNSFSTWVEGGGINGTANEILSLVQLVEGYTRASRDAIEKEYKEAEDLASKTCTVTSGCECTACKVSDGWGSFEVDFPDTMVLTTSNAFRCLAKMIKDTYIRVANLEYDDPTRVGYLYYGHQTDGSYTQWPGMSWCPSNIDPSSSSSPYDPRYRDWYAGTVSGPKDVVIVLDKSGSMGDAGRMGLAQEAAKKVLNTLTFVDFVTIVVFSSTAWAATSTLVPATQENRKRLADIIDRQSPEGGTNFVEAFEAAMQVFANSRGNSCHSSACNGALLFLTDGIPDRFDSEHFDRLKSLNADEYVRIFTFGLGDGAEMEKLERIAAEHNGFTKFVQDGGSLGDAMALYYLPFSAWSGQDGIYDRVRWILYTDIITKGDLLAGCMPAYDMKPQVPKLLGVTCMDINMVVDIDTLRAQPAFDQFKNAYESNSRKCLNGATSSGMPTEDTCGDGWGESWNPEIVDRGFQRDPQSVILLACLAALTLHG